MDCRFCNADLPRPFVDLGFSPPSNAYLSSDALNLPEIAFPLRLRVCPNCWLVQTEDYASSRQLFDKNYAYFSSVSETWKEHCEVYSREIIKKLELNSDSYVIEIASNDGCLTKNFVQSGIPCLGIEPTASTAKEAQKAGVQTLQEFFSSGLAKQLKDQGKSANLIIANNVFAHVPDLNDFTKGLSILLRVGGVITIEVPHLLNIFKSYQFDTVYHEHFSYFSIRTLQQIFDAYLLKIFDVDFLSTHGGSLRIYVCHKQDPRNISTKIAELINEEEKYGLFNEKIYQTFMPKIERIKLDFLSFLIKCKRDGKSVAAYGAAAKGNTFLNYCGVSQDLVPIVFDAAQSKQNKFLPGSHIKIVETSKIKEIRPDVLIILPWNIATEIVLQHRYVSEWGGEFYTAVPFIKKIQCTF